MKAFEKKIKMSSSHNKYTNQPLPLGHVKKSPQLVLTAKEKDGLDIGALIDKLLKSGICEEEDITIYDKFVINPSSEEDEIVEVPVAPKKFEIVDVEEHISESQSDNVIFVKKEPPDPPGIVIKSENVAGNFRESVPSEQIAVKAETNSQVEDNEVKVKLEQAIKRKHSKRSKRRRDSSHNHRSSSRRKHRKKKHYIKSENEEKKILDYSSDSSASCNKSRQKKKKREELESYSDVSSSSDIHRKRRYKKYESSRSRSSSSNLDYESEHKEKISYKSRRHSHNRTHSRSIHSSDSDYSYKSNHKSRHDSDSNSTKSASRKGAESPNSNYTYTRTVTRRRTPSPPPLEDHSKKNVDSKENVLQDSDSLFGSYYRCNICNVTMNNEITFNSHMKGKKHKKSEESSRQAAERKLVLPPVPPPRSVPPIPAHSVIGTSFQQAGSKYSQPPTGYIRVKLDIPSVIQHSLEKAGNPYPGLDKVIEILGVTETSYYCSFCDCACGFSSITSHLNGFKHQMNCLKYYRKDLYDRWSCLPKYKVTDLILGALKNEEKIHGRGLIVVVQDKQESNSNVPKIEITSRNDQEQPSTSAQVTQFAQVKDLDYVEAYVANSVPDPTKSGYYCKLCDSHCNSEAMWHSHISGKRHLSNVKKNPGIAPSKCKYIPATDNSHPKLFDILDRENEDNLPIVGLSQIREVQKPDINVVSFTCYLCGACVSSLEILSHLVSMKHREKYLVSIHHPEMETLKNCHMSDASKSVIIEDICRHVVDEHGSGAPEIYYSKNAVLKH